MAVVLRRGARPASPGGRPQHGALVLDPDAHERASAASIDLTATEFGLLRVLLEFAGRVLSRGELIEQVRDGDYHVTERTIDTHVRRIRAKLRPHGIDPIETVHGVGYKAPAPRAAT